MKSRFVLVFATLATLSLMASTTICDMSNIKSWTTKGGAAVMQDAGPEGKKAIQFTLPGTASCRLPFDDEELDAWDSHAGISFSVKGDGSDVWAPITVGNRYGNYTFIYFFPLKDKEWKRYTVRWNQFIPFINTGFLCEPDGMPPCGINAVAFGCSWKIWFNNARIPKHSFSITDIRLEKSIPEEPQTTFKPASFENVLQKLRDGKTVTIQCQGDSITAGTSLRNHTVERYSIQLENILNEWLAPNAVKTSNRAVGGAKVNDALAWLDRDFAQGAPDLVTIWLGYNDKSGGKTVQYYKKMYAEYIDRIVAKTQGKTAILLFATGPGQGARFTMMDDFAQAVRDLAREKQLPVFDIHAILKAGGKKGLAKYMADTAHPNAKGHLLIAEKLAEYLVKQAKITKPRPVPPPKPVPPAGKEHSWNFDNGAQNWKLEPNLSVTPEKQLLLKADGVYRDHYRAWSPIIDVIADQEYIFSADIFGQLEDGNCSFYIANYSKGKSIMEYSSLTPLRLVKSANWKTIRREYTIPPNTDAIRILLWAHKESKGDIRIDNVKLTPVVK